MDLDWYIFRNLAWTYPEVFIGLRLIKYVVSASALALALVLASAFAKAND